MNPFALLSQADNLYCWGEPSRGNRRLWKNDPWRYVKVSLIPCVIFGVAVWAHLEMSVQVVSWLCAISATLVVYVWLWTFAPRTIRIQRDRLQIIRVGRGLSGSEILFSDVAGCKITPDRNDLLIHLDMIAGEPVEFICTDPVAADYLMQSLKSPNQSTDPTLASGTPLAGPESRHP
jgi:hypothetical protein